MEIYKRGSKGEMVKRIQRALKVLDDGIYGQLTEEAVKDLQRASGLKADGIVGPATLALLGIIAVTSRKKSRRYIDKIVVHCTATPAGKDYTVNDIRKEHLRQGWSDIGYHYVIYRDGEIAEGRDVNIAGAHVVGYNTNSIGVAYVGGLSRDGKKACDTRTNAQKEALASLLKELKTIYPEAKIYGHRDLSPDKNKNGIIEPFEWIKECPCFDAMKEYASL